MRAYAAMIWDEADPEASRTMQRVSAGLSSGSGTAGHRTEAAGFVLHDLSADRARNSIVGLVLDGRPCGAVYGTVFEHASGAARRAPITMFPDPAVARLRRSEGLSMAADFWGPYVAFIGGEASFSVIADPTSSLPCFYARQGGVTFVFSHLEKCEFLDRSKLSINYDFIAKLLAYDKIQTGETGLNEVSELLGGQRLRISDVGVTVDTLWDPREIAGAIHEPPRPDAAEELRETTRSVVQSRASAYRKVTVQLSGGLDSSIVLACLTSGTADFDVNAVHFIADSSDLPEDHYADIAATEAQCRLLKIPMTADDSVPEIAAHPLTARPQRSYLSRTLLSHLGDQASELGEAVFTGQGGDHLFLHTTSPLRFADFLSTHGLWSGIQSELLRAAKLSGKSVWAVMKESLPYILGRAPSSAILQSIEERRTNVNRHASSHSELSRGLPAWVTDAAGLPPAKFDQINNLLHLVHVREVLDAGDPSETVHPLISQPLVELCLRLPTYLLTTNGRSRGLARTAFGGMVHDTIRNRMTKGGASRYYVDGIAANRSRILDRLTHGELVNRGLISASDVQAFFDHGHQ